MIKIHGYQAIKYNQIIPHQRITTTGIKILNKHLIFQLHYHIININNNVYWINLQINCSDLKLSQYYAISYGMKEHILHNLL